jgi:hypothetical protein
VNHYFQQVFSTDLLIPVATCLYSYEKSCEGELSIEQGEIITDIQQNTGSDQWWWGRGKNGTGQFPANYVSLNERKQVKVKALYDFSPSSPGELTFRAGDILIVKQSNEPDWWDGMIEGSNTIGAFPAAYVERVE